MAKCQRRLCKAHLPIPVWYRNSLNIHGIQLQVSLTFKVQGLKWHEWQCGIEHTPQVTWPMPQLGLGWYPCHAMRSTTRRFAWKRLADRVSRTKACEKKHTAGRNGSQRGATCQVFFVHHRGHNPHHPHAVHVFLQPKGKNRPRWNLRNLLRKQLQVASGSENQMNEFRSFFIQIFVGLDAISDGVFNHVSYMSILESSQGASKLGASRSESQKWKSGELDVVYEGVWYIIYIILIRIIYIYIYTHTGMHQCIVYDMIDVQNFCKWKKYEIWCFFFSAL